MSTQQNNFKAIASAIRAKDGTAAKIPAKEFASRILNIPTNRLPSGVYTINAISNNTALGSVTGGGYASAGFTANLTAKRLQTKSKFDGWYENGSLLNDKEKYSFTVQKDRNIVGMFSKMAFQGKWYSADTQPQKGKDIVKYGDGVFLLASAGSTTNFISYDGTNWEAIDSVAATTKVGSISRRAAFQNGIFAYINLTYYEIYYTDDIGATWHTVSPYTGLNSITAGNGYFVITAYNKNLRNYLYKSTDCKKWEAIKLPASIIPSNSTTTQVYSCIYAGGLFFLRADTGTFVTPDLENWEKATWSKSVAFNDIAYGNGRYVAINNLYYSHSTDGYNWTDRAEFPTSSPANQFSSIAYGEGNFVVVSSTSGSSLSLYSTDGVTWQQANLISTDSSAFWRPVVFGGDKFVTCSSSGTAAYLV